MCMYLNDEDEKNCCTIVISVISFVWFSHYISYTHNSTVMCKLFQGYVCTITLLYYCSQRNDKITVFFSFPTFCHEKQRRRRTCVAKKLSSSICTNIRTTRVVLKLQTDSTLCILFLQCSIFVVFMRKSRGGLRKQKAKVFAASLRSFPAIIQAKEN